MLQKMKYNNLKSKGRKVYVIAKDNGTFDIGVANNNNGFSQGGKRTRRARKSRKATRRRRMTRRR